MTENEITRRNQRAKGLLGFEIGKNRYLVESAKGMVFYKVAVDQDKTPVEAKCSCPDYLKNASREPGFLCKHLLSVINGNGNIQRLSSEHERACKARLDNRFITEVKGKEFVLYAGLLDLAHQMGLTGIQVTPVQYPSTENGKEAICKAMITTKTKDRFEEIGDASPSNVASQISNHILRMAATRAKARALRDFTNIGMTCLEELGDIDDVIPKGSQKKKAKTACTNPSTFQEEKPLKPPSKAKSGKNGKQKDQAEKELMSPAQKTAIANLAERRGISEEELKAMSEEVFGVQLDALSSKDASAFIRNLQQSA